MKALAELRTNAAATKELSARRADDGTAGRM